MLSNFSRLKSQPRLAPARPRQTAIFPSALFSVCLLGLVQAWAQESPAPSTAAPQAPPPAPPVVFTSPTNAPTTSGPAKRGLTPTLYSIGQPTDEEQLYLEYINRSRANPPAEGARLAATTDADVLSSYTYYSVDLALMQSQFNVISSVPPLAMNAQLLASARLHSGDMFTNQFQGHDGSDGSLFYQRIAAEGYSYSTAGENVYSYAKSVWYGHAGFNVDWGLGVGGMQNPPGHRQSIHNANFREVGIGVVDGSNGAVGPQLVTQDFGAQFNAQPLICGVVFFDLATNGFYDLGEGLGEVTVLVNGAPFYAVTANSGGYAVPVTTNGTYTVTFSANGLAATQQVTITAGRNAKADLVLPYIPPVVSGPNPAATNQSNWYTISTVPAATNYQWLQAQLAAYTTVEGAETGLANVTSNTSPGYAVITSDVKASGSASFHLAHPTPANQYLRLNPVLRLGTNSQLTFAKRLGWASSTELAKAQVTIDGGATWQDVWSQAGVNSSGDSVFTRVTNSLSAYAGQSVQVRFAYLFPGGSYYPSTASGVGFYFDDIAVSNAERLLNQATNNVSAGASTFAFAPTTATNYLLAARAQLPGRTLNWGPFLRVSAGSPAPSLQLLSASPAAPNQLQLDFTVANYRNGLSFQLWKAPTPAGAWTADAGATFQTLTPGAKYRATTTRPTTNAFYRIKASY